MASFEERELVDYAVKKFEDLVKETDNSYVKKDLDKLFNRINKLEEKVERLKKELKRVFERLTQLGEQVRLLEQESSLSDEDY